jgi:tRNA(Ile)-lysidine synthase TilS/MesJ
MKSNLNYETWVNDNREYLEVFRDRQVFVTYTGGKDASVILHFLIQAKSEFDFEFETHAAMFPVHVYPSGERQKLDSYWKDRGIEITWHSLGISDSAFAVAKQEGRNPCEVCHSTKRNYFLEYLNRTVTDWNSLVVIIGYTLWDIVSYSLEYLLGSVYADRDTLFQGKSIKDRYFQTSQRFYPMLKMKEGYFVLKPLLKYNDQDILRVIQENQIPVQATECIYKEYRPKRLYADLYKKMDLYFDYDKVMKFAQESLDLEEPSTYTRFDKEEFITSIF